MMTTTLLGACAIGLLLSRLYSIVAVSFVSPLMALVGFAVGRHEGLHWGSALIVGLLSLCLVQMSYFVGLRIEQMLSGYRRRGTLDRPRHTGEALGAARKSD